MGIGYGGMRFGYPFALAEMDISICPCVAVRRLVRHDGAFVVCHDKSAGAIDYLSVCGYCAHPCL